LDGDAASAVFAIAYLGEIQARRKISSACAEENSSALDQQSLGTGMAGTGGGSEHRQIIRRPKTRMDHQNGRTILYRAGVFAVAAKFLGKIGFVPGSVRFEAQEEHA